MRSLIVAALAGLVVTLVPSGTATAAEPDYHRYVKDVYGADLGACREPARKGKAWRIRGLVDATGTITTTKPIIGGLVVTVGGKETSRRWLSGDVAVGQAATGSLVVPKSSNGKIYGFVGIDGAGDSFTRSPAAIASC